MKLKSVLKLKKIDLSKMGRKGGNKEDCDHKGISANKTYMVKYEGEMLVGNFEREWYGWNFCWFGMTYCGLQLDCLDEVWEVVS